MRQVTAPQRGKMGLGRAARRLHAWASRIRPLRSGTGSFAALGVFAVFIGAGVVQGGKAPLVVGVASSAIGLATDNISITGQVETAEYEVLAALGATSVSTLVAFDTRAARERLKALPWVRDAAIRKLYPGKLDVILVEKTAAAVWQYDDNLTVIDKSGALIDKFGISDLLNDRFSHLPHLVGDGAAAQAGSILPLVAPHPQIAGRVQAFLRVADRRWDLLLSAPGNVSVRVMLPQNGVEQAIERFAQLQAELQVLDRQINSVDLRLADRVVLSLDEEAVEARNTLVAARKKAVRKLVLQAKERTI